MQIFVKNISILNLFSEFSFLSCNILDWTELFTHHIHTKSKTCDYGPQVDLWRGHRPKMLGITVWKDTLVDASECRDQTCDLLFLWTIRPTHTRSTVSYINTLLSSLTCLFLHRLLTNTPLASCLTALYQAHLSSRMCLLPRGAVDPRLWDMWECVHGDLMRTTPVNRSTV